MTVARRVGAAVLLVAVVAVWFVMAPPEVEQLDSSNAIATIEAEDEGNNDLADGAPQQAVVNGWTEHNYLALISDQIDQTTAPAPRDDRPVAMLGLCAVGIALIAFTTPRPQHASAVASS